MKSNIYFFRFFCIAALLFSTFFAKASNITGSYIGYEAIDSTHYKVMVFVYHDCNGIPINSVVLDIVGKSTGAFTKTLPLVSSTDITTPFLGCGAKSRCSGSYSYGFEEIIFADTIDISGGGCTYTFSVTSCCRGGSISTGAANTVAYNYATVNKCVGLNTAPRPTTLPQMLLPVGQDVSISPTMIDFTDHDDSVVFSLEAPLDNSGSAITYSGQFTKDRPFTHFGFPNNTYSGPAGFHINSVTGEITFRPTKQNEVGVFVIEAKEYRKISGNYELVGVVRLELTNIVTPSHGNNIPKIQASGLSQNICSGQKTCISFTSTDADNGDTTSVSVTSTLPGAVYTDTRSGVNGSGELCWTPTASDVRLAPYLVTATVRDNACTVNGYKTYTYALYVKPAYDTSNHAVVSKTVSCNRASIVAGKDTFTDLSLDWKAESGLIDTIIGDSAVLFFKNPGWNRFAIRSKNSNGCLGPYEWDSVFISPLYGLQISKTADTAACVSDTFQLSVLPLNGSAPYKYFWADAPTIHTPTVNLNSAQTSYHLVSVSDGAGCFTTDSIRVAISSPSATVGPDTSVCAYTQINLTAKNPTGIAPFKYEWLGIDTLPNVSATVGATTTAYKLKISDSTGCSNIITRNITPFKFSLSLQGDSTPVCYGSSTKITADAYDGLAPYTFPWVTISTTRASYTYTPVADSVFTVSITDTRGCKAYDTIIIKSNPPIIITMPTAIEACTGTDLTLTAVVSGGTNPYMYGWNNTNGTSNVYQFKVNNTTTLMKLKVTDSVNCSNTQNINITVLPNPTANAGFDNTICYGAGANLSGFASSGTAPYNFAWSNGDSVNTTTVKPITTTKYKVVVTDSKGCKGEDEVLITVLPRDIITVTAPFTICSNYPAVPLMASKPGGTWSGTGVSGNAFNPSAVSAGKHQLYYSFIGSNSCPMQDTTEAEVITNITQADFTASVTTGGASSSIQFFDASMGSPTSWQWRIKDNTTTSIQTSAQQNPTFVFNSLGTYDVTLIVFNGSCYDTIVKKDYITITNVGLADIENSPYKIYPNPASTQITVEGENITRVAIADIQGRPIQAPISNTANTYYLNVTGIASGVYIVTVEDANRTIYRKKIAVGR